MDPGEIPQEIKKRIETLKVWYFYGSREAEIVVDMDDLIEDLEEWIEDSAAEWSNQDIPVDVLDDQISEFEIFLDVKLQERASKIEDRIQKSRRDMRTVYHPEYHDNLLDTMEQVMENFNTERTRLRNSLKKAQDELEKNQSPERIAGNLAEIEQTEENRVDEIQNQVRNMRKICVKNNLVRAMKISRILP